MFKLFLSLFDKLKNNYYIVKEILYLRKIKPKYLFFSENKTYQKYTYLLIEALVKKYPNEVYYVSADINDKINNIGVRNIFIGKGFLMNIFFLIIRAQNIYLTVTDLGNHAVKKTKNVDNYVYYFHSPLSTSKIYTETAFDNYDVILCNGDYHFNEIRKRESQKKIKKKKLIKTGYFYFDYLKDRINNQVEANEILIAPSWNYNQKNFINENLEEIIRSVLKKGYNVKFRPHPENFKRSMNIINSFKKNFSNEKFILDENTENINSMENAKCLITDNSGIAIEFLLLFKKPVLYFEDIDKVHNTKFNEYNDLVTMDQKVKKTFGYIFKKEDIKDLDTIINKSISDFRNKDAEINDFINNNFYNYGMTIKNLNDLINTNF
tara:strand:- start:70 stop:1206 length:1137 start_codon:yes stop_codon:yes gene_type:complete